MGTRFFNECFRNRILRIRSHFLLGCICEESQRFSNAHDYFTESFNLDNSHIRSLEGKIRMDKELITQGDEYKKADLIQDELLLETLLQDDNE